MFRASLATCAALLAAAAFAQAQTPPKVLLVSDNFFADSRNNTGVPGIEDPELPFVNFLTGLGYEVIRGTGAAGGTEGQPAAQFRGVREGYLGAAGAGADLIIISRVTNSGDYANNGEQIAGWNSISTPMIVMNPQIARNNRWLMANFGAQDEASSATLDFEFTPVGQSIYEGLGANLFDPPANASDVRSYSRVDLAPDASGQVGSGTVLATFNGDAGIILYTEGLEYYPGSGQTPGGPRIIFGGLRYHESSGSDRIEFEDLSENGKAILARTLSVFVPIPEPGTLSLLALAAPSLLLRRRKA